MAVFCIPKHLVEKLKKSALKGEVNIKELYSMSSDARRAFFTKFTDQELGRFINVEFEKAVLSKQKMALTDWAKSVFSPEAKLKPSYQTVLSKIQSLDDMGVLSPKSEEAFLRDLVADKIGISVGAEEVKEIAERAKQIDQAQIALGPDLGNPKELEKNMAFFEAKKNMDDYLLSLAPASKLKVASGTIGRGMMLASIKSPILNIGSNTILGVFEALTRRLAGLSLRGADNGLAMDYFKMVNKIYQKTGYDLSRMENLSDTGASGERILGDVVHAQGPGALRRLGRVVEDVVFKQLMGAPDAAFAAAHFADSVNLESLKVAKGDKTAARLIMEDAMRINPQTPQGELLRLQGILDAQYATWTNDSKLSQASMLIRDAINRMSGDLRLGDQTVPFVKTPANVISTGLDYAGLGAVKALRDTIKAFKSGDLGSREYRQKTGRNLVHAGLGLTAAVLIAQQLSDDDFVGVYDPARAQIEQLRNSASNSIRVGGKWISTDWLGPLSVPVTAILYARKYGQSKSDKAIQFGQGLVSNVARLPGVSQAIDFYLERLSKKNQSSGEIKTQMFDWVTNFVYSRAVPSILGDIAKATDPFERKTGTGISSIQAKMPGLRNKLPIKKTILGEQIKTEGALTTLLFGSRVKTDRETDLIRELDRVAKANGKAINFTDWDRSTSQAITQFKTEFPISDFDSAKERYAFHLKTKLEEIIKNPKYDQLSEEERLDLINKVDSAAVEKVFAQFHFKPYRAPKRVIKVKI